MKINPIKLHPFEITSELAYTIAYCIGASYDDEEEIANLIPHDLIMDVLTYIRKTAIQYEEV